MISNSYLRALQYDLYGKTLTDKWYDTKAMKTIQRGVVEAAVSIDSIYLESFFGKLGLQFNTGVLVIVFVVLCWYVLYSYLEQCTDRYTVPESHVPWCRRLDSVSLSSPQHGLGTSIIQSASQSLWTSCCDGGGFAGVEICVPHGLLSEGVV